MHEKEKLLLKKAPLLNNNNNIENSIINNNNNNINNSLVSSTTSTTSSPSSREPSPPPIIMKMNQQYQLSPISHYQQHRFNRSPSPSSSASSRSLPSPVGDYPSLLSRVSLQPHRINNSISSLERLHTSSSPNTSSCRCCPPGEFNHHHHHHRHLSSPFSSTSRAMPCTMCDEPPSSGPMEAEAAPFGSPRGDNGGSLNCSRHSIYRTERVGGGSSRLYSIPSPISSRPRPQFPALYSKCQITIGLHSNS